MVQVITQLISELRLVARGSIASQLPRLQLLEGLASPFGWFYIGWWDCAGINLGWWMMMVNKSQIWRKYEENSKLRVDFCLRTLENFGGRMIEIQVLQKKKISSSILFPSLMDPSMLCRHRWCPRHKPVKGNWPNLPPRLKRPENRGVPGG